MPPVSPKVTRSLEIRATPAKVWRFFASQDGLRRWISPNLEIDLKVGGRYRFLGPDDKTWVTGHVLEIAPQAWLILSWQEQDQGWEHPARLVLSLEASATGTRATMSFDGFAGIGVTSWHDVVADYQRGSDAHKTLEKLAALVMEDAD